MTKWLRFDGFRIQTGEDWEDISAALESPSKPFTIAKHDGVGALQFSPAIYRGGPAPLATKDDLCSMLRQFADQRGLGKSFDASVFENVLIGVGASFHKEDDFVRVWYVTDKQSFLLVTYVCDWDDQDRELSKCERMLQGIQFDN